MNELYQMVNAFLPPSAAATTTHVSSSSSPTFIADAPNPATTTDPPTTAIPLINNYNLFYDDQMLLMGEITTTTPTTLVDEWDMIYAMDNGFSSHTNTNTIVASSSSSSSVATATSTTTTLHIPPPIINNNVIVGQTPLDDNAIINLDLYGKVNNFSNSTPPPPPPRYNPHVVVAPSSTSSTTTTTTTTTTPYNYLDAGTNFEWNMAPAAGDHRSSTIFATTPTIQPAIVVAAGGVHNQAAAAAANSISTTATATNFQGKRLNLYQPMNEKNIRNLLQTSNNPLNYSKRQKAPLSTNKWPILSLPCLGKIPDPPNPSSSTHKQQQHNQLLQHESTGRQDISKSVKIHAPHTSSKSKEWKKEKRVYKMPRQGLSTEMYSWRYYGEKLVNGSSNPRKYFKCTFKDCAAKRCVEMDEIDPDMVIVKYSGHHNHLMPMFLNNSMGSTGDVGAPLDNNNHNNNNLKSSSKTLFSSSPMILKKNTNNNDNIFDGLEKLVDL